MPHAFPYPDAATEEVACNLCGGRAVEPIGDRDRNGLPVTSVICRHCGLIFLSPRMTAEWYGKYYQLEYRRQMAAFHGGRATPQTPERIFTGQLRHGSFLTEYLSKAGGPPPASVLDVGSSAGGVLKAFQERFGCRVLGIEPSPEEAEFARSRGVPTEAGLFEEVSLPSDVKFDLIICTQSFNHLLDPHGVAERVLSALSPAGLFLLECQNFFDLCRFWGDRRMATQIDHTYMFAPVTLQAMLAVSGFEVQREATEIDNRASARTLRLRRRLGIPSLHVRLLARRSAQGPQPAPHLYPFVTAELDRLPNSPFRSRLARGLERQLMRWDNLWERVGRTLGLRRSAA